MKSYCLRITVIVCMFLGLAEGAHGQRLLGPYGYVTVKAASSAHDSLENDLDVSLLNLYIMSNFAFTPRFRFFTGLELDKKSEAVSHEQVINSIGFVGIEQVWLEFDLYRYLNLRVGKFLTPFGIFNEINSATPAYHTTQLPAVIYGEHRNPVNNLQRFYAKNSVGFQFYSEFTSKKIEFRIQALLVNGRGNNFFKTWNTRDAGVALRVMSGIPKWHLRLGSSLYTDRNDLALDTRQSALGFDAQYEYRRWLVNTEVMFSSLAYVENRRKAQQAVAAYGEVVYHLFDRQSILARFSYFDLDKNIPARVEKVLTAGTSIYLVREVLLKTEVQFHLSKYDPGQSSVFAVATLSYVFKGF